MLIVISSSCAIRAVKGLVLSHKAGSEIRLYQSVPLLPDRQPDNICTSAFLSYHTCTYSDSKRATLNNSFTIYSTVDQWSQLHNSNLVTSMAQPSEELRLSGTCLNDVLPTL